MPTTLITGGGFLGQRLAHALAAQGHTLRVLDVAPAPSGALPPACAWHVGDVGDFDTVEVIVDGATVATLPVTAADADPGNPAIRWQRTIPVDVAAAGSWVVVAAHGAGDLAPVHPGRAAFGVTNPIFLRR